MSGESTPCLQVCGHSLEEVTKFTYLGSVQSTTGRCVNQTLSGALASLLYCHALYDKSLATDPASPADKTSLVPD